MENIFWLFSDIWAMVYRNLLKYVRIPRLLVFSSIQPIMFLLLFAFVFGGAIAVPGGHYINFLLPGILVQTVMFGATNTGLGLSDDMSKGLIDRFRSLPMARSAVLAGRTISDMIRNIVVVTIMTVVGTFIGFTFPNGIFHAMLGMALAVLFGFAFSWVSACIGLMVRDPETAQIAGFIWVFPLVFASSVFVPVDTMPSALRWFAQHSPITVTVDAMRGLMLGGDVTAPLLQSFAWIAGILLVFVPLAVRAYKKAR